LFQSFDPVGKILAIVSIARVLRIASTISKNSSISTTGQEANSLFNQPKRKKSEGAISG
jgi:hypothetical protein